MSDVDAIVERMFREWIIADHSDSDLLLPLWEAIERAGLKDGRDGEYVIASDRSIKALIASIVRAALSAQESRYREALEDIVDYRGGADSALDDEYVMERARAALAAGSGEMEAT